MPVRDDAALAPAPRLAVIGDSAEACRALEDALALPAGAAVLCEPSAALLAAEAPWFGAVWFAPAGSARAARVGGESASSQRIESLLGDEALGCQDNTLGLPAGVQQLRLTVPVIVLATGEGSPFQLSAAARDKLERAFPRFDCVVAADAQGGIGRNNDLPWPPQPADLKHFARLTTAAAAGKRNAVVMGRKTWESIPPRYRPLPKRHNVLVTRSEAPDGTLGFRSLACALAGARALADIDALFVIGGAQLYREAFVHPRCRNIYYTEFHQTYACDRFIAHPRALGFELDASWPPQLHHGDGVTFAVERWRNPRPAPTPPPET